MRYPVRLFLLTASFLITSTLLLSGFHSPQDEKNTKSNTGGELSFTIRTVTASGTYAPKHVLAIWIEHNGDFIKTCKAMANQRKQYLYTWKAASDYNVVDAITGPTLTSHQTHTVTWNCSDLDGNLVPEGDYTVFTEFTDKHAQGPLYALSFTKGPDAVNLTPADETYFKDIALNFIPYVAAFSSDVNSICQWETVTFTDESTNATSWDWDFGEGSYPATASTEGPHAVYYTTPGSKTPSLTINGSVTETKTDFIDVSITPEAAFSFSSNALTVDFTNLSANATTYLWEFGDGSTSTENNPSHTYASAGSFNVTLHAGYLGCEDEETLEVIIPLVGVTETVQLDKIRIFPNPSKGIFNLGTESSVEIKKIGIFAATGRFFPMEITRVENNSLTTVDVSGLEAGIYFLRLETQNGYHIRKIVIR